MGAYLFVIEQSIQDVDSDEFPQNVGRFFVVALVYQRPEISNLTMFSQWSQSPEGLTRILENLFKQGGSTNGAGGGKSRRQIMQSGIDFRVQDLEAVAAMTDEQLKQAYEILNSRMLEQLRTSFQRRGGPRTALVGQSFESMQRSQQVARDLIAFDKDNNEVVDFKELVNYLRPTLWSEVLFIMYVSINT